MSKGYRYVALIIVLVILEAPITITILPHTLTLSLY